MRQRYAPRSSSAAVVPEVPTTSLHRGMLEHVISEIFRDVTRADWRYDRGKAETIVRQQKASASWLLSDDEGPLTFLACCFLLQLDPEAVRESPRLRGRLVRLKWLSRLPDSPAEDWMVSAESARDAFRMSIAAGLLVRERPLVARRLLEAAWDYHDDIGGPEHFGNLLMQGFAAGWTGQEYGEVAA